MDIVKDTITKIADEREKHLIYIGSGYFAGSYESNNIYKIKDDEVKEYKGFKYLYSIDVSRDRYSSIGDTYIMVSGPNGLGLLDPNGDFVIEPVCDTIFPELAFMYFDGNFYGEKHIRIKE